MTNRFPARAIEATGYVGDGAQALHDDGTWKIPAGGGGGGTGQGLVDFARAKRTSGNITINSSTFVDIDTGLDLVLTASAGDVIECNLVANVSKSTSGSSHMVFDFHTIVGGSPVNSLSADGAAGAGLANSYPAWARGWVGLSSAGFPGEQLYSGTKRYTLQAGDISAGTVRLRLRGFCGASMVIRASDPFLYVEATNYGPPL